VPWLAGGADAPGEPPGLAAPDGVGLAA
jgi:hypothetical protein